jgi:sugar phosphate isomerase/epimerase
LWGSESLSFETFCKNASEAGYDGVEMALPLDDGPRTRAIIQALEENGLQLIAQHWETADADIERHIDLFRQRLEWQASARPEFINSQTGRDWFSFEDNQRITDAADEVSKRTGIKIVHETHRGKFTFCAAQTRRFLLANPDLRLTADFSHWCNVSDSLLEDQGEAVAAAIGRADHMHARIGHPEGPQVTDPRAPEWEPALSAHLAWWDAIIESRRSEGAERFTITPEFGPVPYMPTLPFTNQPVADQWAINAQMMNLPKERYA